MLGLMTVLTFVFFITLDYFLHYRKAKYTEPVVHAETVKLPAVPVPVAIPVPAGPSAPLEPTWVAGYEMPQDLHYHPGHVWARPLSPEVVEVGMDDFARRLVGGPEDVKLPRIGDWITQGAASFDVKTNGRTAHLVSPVSGEVVAVNKEFHGEEPYRRGWFCQIRNAGLANNLRNLLTGGLAARWMEDSRKRLEVQLMALSGTVLADGGEPASDFARQMDKDDWRHLAEDFFLVHLDVNKE